MIKHMPTIRVKAFPDAKKDHIEQVSPGVFRVFVRDPAQNNQANKRILSNLAHHLNIPTNHLRMITGHQGPNKTIEILGQ